MIAKLLIANRGEIAIRIARTARAMGIPTVAVFSEADRHARHVRAADEAAFIGPPAPRDSYLNAAAILEAARKTGADAIHPGYGFLAENADFALACDNADLTFVGPPAAVIRKMGDKAAAKALAQSAGVPCVPGYMGADQSDGRLHTEAERVGFPLLVKAVAGGGGRGIRAVNHASELAAALAAARREAASAFGDDRLMLERLIERPRHLEVQVFGDRYGNVIHLGERDCTAQRRRQKIIEETPSPVLTSDLRQKLTGFAVAAARAAGYVNAGTVEFIVDEGFNIYFLEMNTRLQVEHPVTEMVTGLDLVEWQLRVAAGERLPLLQDDISFSGHAIEARLCAEDPYAGFEPKTGVVLHWAMQPQAGLRVEAGVETGSEVPPYYDSMLAKVVAYGRDRSDATRRLVYALARSPLLGLQTNQGFLAAVLRSQAFREATLFTTTIDHWAAESSMLLARPQPTFVLWALAAALHARRHSSDGNWLWSGVASDLSLDLECQGQRKRLRCTHGRNADITVRAAEFTLVLTSVSTDGAEVRFEENGVIRRAHAAWDTTKLHLSAEGASFIFSEHAPVEDDRAFGDGTVVAAPVSGLVLKVFVEQQQMIEPGETLALIEAMKMETRVTASVGGRVARLHTAAGAQVSAGALLFEIEREDRHAHV